jgi:WD40 repeat protein
MARQEDAQEYPNQGQFLASSVAVADWQNAHPGGVSGVSWSEGNEKIISAGADGCVRTWTVAQI